MPNFEQEVRRRLDASRMPDSFRDDVVAELAAHLEDVYADLVRHGCNEQQARDRVIAEAGNWAGLRRRICNAKEDGMTGRLRKVWLPGISCFLTAILAEQVLFAMRIWPRFFRLGQYAQVPVNWVFLLLLVACGALGAYLALRAGATTRQRLLAVILPPMFWASLFLVGGALATIGGLFSARFRTPPHVVVQGLAGAMLGFVFIPAVPLILGALPFLGREIAPAAPKEQG